MPAASLVSGCFYRSSMCSPACPTTFASSLWYDEELSPGCPLFPPASRYACESVLLTCSGKVRIKKRDTMKYGAIYSRTIKRQYYSLQAPLICFLWVMETKDIWGWMNADIYSTNHEFLWLKQSRFSLWYTCCRRWEIKIPPLGQALCQDWCRNWWISLMELMSCWLEHYSSELQTG